MASPELRTLPRFSADVAPDGDVAPARPRLRVGVMIDDPLQPRWVASIIDNIRMSDFAEIALIIRNTARPLPGGGFFAKLRRAAPFALYRIYMHLDERLFRTDPDPFAEVDIGPNLEGIPVIEVEPRTTRFSDYFDDDVVDRIVACELDVALRFGFRILKGRSLEIARYGVWSYHHGDNLRYRGGPAGFWEVADDEPVTGSVLQILTEELDNGKVIYRSHFATDRLSVWRNRQNYYWKSATFVVRVLAALHRRGSDALKDPLGTQPAPYSRRLYRNPTNAEMVRFIARLATRFAAHFWESRARTPEWFIAYRIRKHPVPPDAAPDTTFYRFKHLIPPPGRYWADPFPVRYEGADFIFFEEYLEDVRRGRIACIEVKESGPVGPPRVVLEQNTHLSYPHVLRWNDDLYMIPESRERGRIELYRCVSFPDRWESAAVLIDGIQAVDASVIQWKGRWWMFVAMSETPSQSATERWVTSLREDLHIYYADDLHGPWQPHTLNPVKTDVRSARPAGRPFIQDGKLFRPAQDGSRTYGRAIAIQHVRTLDPDRFEEVPTSIIDPDWAPGLTGNHTLNGNEGITVIDGLRHVPRAFRRPRAAARSQ